MKTLVTIPGMKKKLERFMDEIKADPYLENLDSATGSAEALHVAEDIYSRRFDRINRLLYRVERDENGAVCVKILSLLTHYKGLHLR